MDKTVVVISGAAGGLGAALVRRYAQQGAVVVGLDRDAEALARLGASLSSNGGDAPDRWLPVALDITDPEAVGDAVAHVITRFGRLDILINNAGISHRSLLADTDPAVITRVMAVNFFGTLHLTHAALPHLLASRGRIAAVSSVAGFAPLIGRTGYAASKHALHGFFDSLRSEVEDQGVSVSLIAPSFIATGIGAAALGSSSDGKAAGPRVTAGGESTPDEIAARIVAGIAERRVLLLPDRTSRLAWWFSRVLPAAYARTMKRRVGAEFNL